MEAAKINAIKRYLSENGIQYYDVQAELIDHFATAVERAEKESPGIHFQEALHKAHRSFGGKEGFRKYIDEAQAVVQKKTNRMMAQTLLLFLKWPYFLFTIVVTLIWYFVIQNYPSALDGVSAGFFISFLIVAVINHLRLRKVNMFLPRRTNKALGLILYFTVYIPGFTFFRNSETISPATLLLYFVFLSLSLVAFYRIPTLAIKETRKLYPQIA